MKIKIIKGVIANGQPADVGQVLDLPQGIASYLIRAGKAVANIETPAKVEEDHAEPVQPESRIAQAPTRRAGRPSKKTTQET